ncbi:MAG: flavin-containing monooxygenase [Pseudomonadales bacterium]
MPHSIPDTKPNSKVDYDVIIVGAGLSGIGAAYHLKQQCPGKSFHILENRDAIGGTWDIFRYPGVRSDSDMFTLGYEFKPWLGDKVLADGPAIKDYVRATADDNDITRHISFGQQVLSANWSSIEKCWSLTVNNNATGEKQELSCSLMLMCSGYYSYSKTYEPEFKNIEGYQGQVIHPQFWPEDLDYNNKKIVVIGSGATAVTLIPVLAETAASVTMLQRSPTYMANRPQEDSLAKLFRKLLPTQAAYNLTRWKNAMLQRATYVATRIMPSVVKAVFIKGVRKELGPDYDVDTHFTPKYNPWDQRLCAVPDNDIFKSIAAGKADVVTDEIECFTASGIRTKSGTELEADIVITATGLQLAVNGEVDFSKDGKAVDFAETWSYKGLMFSGVPNLVNTFGYINASWTLRADMIANFTCRLLNEMDRSESTEVIPELRSSDSDMQARLWIEDFPAGYMQRSMHLFPKQGDREPWLNTQNYSREKKTIGKGALNDGVLQFST